MSEWDHYAAIVAILRACDIAAKLVGNSASMAVKVETVEGSAILWSRAGSVVWRYSAISPEGEIDPHVTDLSITSTSEEVARFIMDHDYSSPPEFIGSNP